jgi:photosystem II stability/assembly factor-like uncharacterized protein
MKSVSKTCFLVVLTVLAVSARAQWFWQNPKPQGNILHSMFFINSQEGWAGGENGTIIHTADGGNTWDIQYNFFPNIVYSVFFLDSQTGYAAGGPPDWTSTIYKTTDGGANWQCMFPFYMSDRILNNIFFVNGQVGWAVGERSEAYRTDDGGSSWASYPVGTNDDFNAVWFTDAMHGWIVSSFGIIYRTLNGGYTWSSDTLSLHPLLSICFTGDSTGYICGYQGLIFKTEDGGNSWTQKTSALSGTLNKIQFVSQDTGFIVGDGVERTIDGGNTWQVLTTQPYYSGSFPVGSTGYVTGAFGLISKSEDYGATWNRLGEFAGFYGINASYFLDENDGWLIGLDDSPGTKTWRTRDGGETWAPIDTQYNYFYVKNLFFTDTLNGWATGTTGIYHTQDGGYSWYTQYYIPEYSNEFGPLFFTDRYTGWTSREDTLYTTHDGGTTWQTSVLAPSASLWSKFFLDQNTGWIGGGANDLFKTTDGGTTWNVVCSSLTYGIGDIVFTDPLNGWGYSYEGILHSHDGGATWVVQDYSSGYCSVSFADSLNGWALGGRGSIYHTSDGGHTWEWQDQPGDEWYSSIRFVNINTGWAVGRMYTILKTMNGGLVGVKPVPIGRNPVLLSASPNPAGTFSTIRYSVPHEAHVSLVLYDPAGREIARPVDAQQSAGEYSLNQDVSGLAPGVYFYRLRIADREEVRKLIVAR